MKMELVCKVCWKRWAQLTPLKYRVKTLNFKPILHRYLYNWQGENPFLEELHRYLKTTNQKLDPLLTSFIHFEKQPRKIVFIPVPGSAVSLNLAKSFQRFKGGEIHNILEWSYKMAPHKQLSKADRLKSRMVLKDPLPTVKTKTTFILVDDVVTTGATAKAVFEALSKPRGFEVWSLSCRDL